MSLTKETPPTGSDTVLYREQISHLAEKLAERNDRIKELVTLVHRGWDLMTTDQRNLWMAEPVLTRTGVGITGVTQ